ncbi:MAG: glycosyltransferase [Patescibacteria group bacterium]
MNARGRSCAFSMHIYPPNGGFLTLHNVIGDIFMNTTRKKILYVITKSVWGGAQRYVFDLVTEFQNEYEIVVACGGDGPLIKRLHEKGVRTISIEAFQRDVNLKKEFQSFFELWRTFRKERPDIVHLNSSKAGGLGALAARLAGVNRIIFTSHGLPFEEDRPLSQKIPIWLATWITFFLSHQVILISTRNFSRAGEMPFLKKKVCLIHNAILPPSFEIKEKAREVLADKAGASFTSLEKKLWIGTIAELTKNKNLMNLIHAVHTLVKKGADITLIIIGDGELKENLEKEIRECTLESHVFIVSIPVDAGRYIPAFDIFSLVSLKEGYPYVLLEAAAAGIPVVGSNVGGIGDIVTDMESGILVRPKNVKEISGALTLLIEECGRREMYGEKLKASMQPQLSLEKMVAETKKTYEA